MFNVLNTINSRPAPFAHMTVRDLWTDPHVSERMLAFHLDPEVGLSSRRTDFIDRSVDWIVSRFRVGPGTSIADFGCGPGLYAIQLARRHASITGIDFSERSIGYARSAAGKENLEIDYRCLDYLTFQPDVRFDLALLIFCDYCALSPEQRRTLLGIFHSSLAPEGRLLFDVHSPAYFDQRTESASYERNAMDGFWSPNDYYAFMNNFKYDPEGLLLDKYTIVEADRTRTIYNWLQCFSPESLEAELAASGFAVEALHGDVAGAPYDPALTDFAVIARPQA